MNRLFHTAAVAAISLSGTVLFVPHALACGGHGGGRGYGGYRYGGYSSPAYYPQYSYAQPQPYGYPQSAAQRQPAYYPNQYPQQQVAQQQAPPMQPPPVIRRISNNAPTTVNRPAVANVAAVPARSQQTFAPQPSPSQAQAPVQQQTFAQQRVATQQPAPVQQPAPQQQQGIAQQPAPQRQQSIAQQPAATQPSAAQPVAQTPPQTADVQVSALEALGGFDEPAPAQQQPQVQQQPQQPAPQAQAQTSPAQQTPAASQGLSPVGNWRATIASGASVQLTLGADGSFRWSATSNGKTSTFEGTYSLENGQLTLVRGSDNQKLNGTITPNENGFNFKLAGGKDNGLNFARS